MSTFASCPTTKATSKGCLASTSHLPPPKVNTFPSVPSNRSFFFSSRNILFPSSREHHSSDFLHSLIHAVLDFTIMLQSFSVTDPSNTSPMVETDDGSVLDVCKRIAKRMSPNVLESYYGDEARAKRAKLGNSNPLEYLLKLALSPSLHRILQKSVDRQLSYHESPEAPQYHSLLEVDAQVQIAFQTFAQDFPTAIWTCCAKRCFARVAILTEDSGVFNAVLKIHNRAEALHERIEGLGELLQSRRRSSGRSSITHARKTLQSSGTHSGTDRQRIRSELKDFIRRSLPYLRAQNVAADGTPAPAKPFCIQAICQILGVQRNTLYKPVSNAVCVIDDAGVRQRKFRRVGSRKGFKELSELPGFKCDCDIWCFSGLHVDILQRLWNGFRVISGQLSPEEKEHRYLINQMFCPLTNTSVRLCNKAIGQLYTISESLVASIRLIVHQMCEDPAIQELPARKHGMKRYREKHHPLNRFSEEVIEHVERHLDMVLRPDPAAADGANICRVYSPEVNTQEKLRKLIARDIQRDTEEVQISPASLQRMINAYLEKRQCRISFSQSDHNACPTCKSYHCEILFLYYERKQLSEKLSFYRQLPRPMTQEDQARYCEYAVPLLSELEIKEYREQEAIYELQLHNQRDARIRGWLKQLTDHLREEENKARQRSVMTGERDAFGWCQRRNFALVTHQDDMTKVDLPHVVVDASADITRWRFDVSAHVNAVTGDCVVLSHEQGTGSKNASSILEMILLDHIVTCKGESIKVVVSDNASVGKNWISTVAFPQYLVDQGLADIVLIVFLENNHGKWLADMLFGQFQIRKRNCTILGIDGLLQEFESINRPNNGCIKGYAVNPLGCVNLAEVFAELGYETKPPKDFGFKNRDIHFAAACRPNAKEHLSPRLKKLFYNALPAAAGMVRLCSEPPNDRPNSWRRFNDRWIDVPAASRVGDVSTSAVSPATEAPLVIPREKEFAAKGPCVVSKRTAEHVGFNGLSFRGKMSFPELEGERYVCTREAWPPGLLQAGEPGYESESLRCAPENWILRKPVRHYGDGDRNLKARYPPKNLLNALFLHGPRAEGVSVEPDELLRWIPTATYLEPPFPIERQHAATEALRDLAQKCDDIHKELNLLEVLRAIYEKMGDRESVSDVWLQKPATVAPASALQEYNKVLRTLQKRDAIRPRSVTTIFQAFREDSIVLTEVEAETARLSERDARTRQEIVVTLFEAETKRTSPQLLSTLHQDMGQYNVAIQAFSDQQRTKRAVERELREQEKRVRQRRAKVMTTLFERWKLKPGALDRFHRLVEQDKQRYAKELKLYREETSLHFDKEHDLAPIEGPMELRLV